ncbi:hypothetical protein [Aestuariibius sp. HNIBRBA575]|uniref:hypothetical protein n=1 Tax=Aestuariibius sp. HNIBRBA575 TaxID=3233343 RepID=UPI0034A1C2DF
MNSSNAARLPLFIGILIVLMGAVALMKGGLLIGKHEGDTLHLMQIVFRMSTGQVPHIDFMTPIGALAFAPIVFFVKQGFGIGISVIYAQILMAVLIAPIVWHVARTRFNQTLGLLFALVIMVMMLALVHGESERAISISMHYNRWAWSAAFVAILTALIPSKGKTGIADGVIVGGMMAVLVMIKMTYFAAFAIPVLVALIVTRQYMATIVSLLTGVGIIAVITMIAGDIYWTAYLTDLITVAGSEVRPQPGEDFVGVISAPAYKGASLLALASVIVLRQSGAKAAGLVLLLLLPGFFYVTFQNFGNDPQWLWVLALILFAWRPAADVVNSYGWNMRQAVNITGAMALAFGMPSFFNLAFSPFRHIAIDATEYAPLLPRGGRHSDIQTNEVRAMRVDARVAWDGEGSGLEAYKEAADRDDLTTFMGETFEYCSIELGLSAFFDAITQDLENSGWADGRKLFAADLFSSYWLFGNLTPVDGGAPWYYGGLPGYEDADLLLVPICPLAYDVHGQVLEAIQEVGTDDLTEVRRTPLYILYEKGGAQSEG